MPPRGWPIRTEQKKIVRNAFNRASGDFYLRSTLPMGADQMSLATRTKRPPSRRRRPVKDPAVQAERAAKRAAKAAKELAKSRHNSLSTFPRKPRLPTSGSSTGLNLGTHRRRVFDHLSLDAAQQIPQGRRGERAHVLAGKRHRRVDVLQAVSQIQRCAVSHGPNTQRPRGGRGRRQC